MCADEKDWSGNAAQVFDAVLRSLTDGRERGGADQPRWLFPNGIGYLELKFEVAATPGMTLIVSGEPQKPSNASTFQLSAPIAIADHDPHLDPRTPDLLMARLAPGDLPWRPAECLKTLLGQVNARYPDRKKGSDGTIGDEAHCHGGNPTSSDHCAWIVDGDHRVVSALDITHDPQHGCDAGTIANGLVKSRDSRIKYVIWNRHIAASYAAGGAAPWAWRPYTGRSPHTEHVHLSVLPEKTQYDSTTPWSDQIFG